MKLGKKAVDKMSVTERLIARWSRSRIEYPFVRARALRRGRQAEIAERDYYPVSVLYMADELRTAAHTRDRDDFECV